MDGSDAGWTLGITRLDVLDALDAVLRTHSNFDNPLSSLVSRTAKLDIDSHFSEVWGNSTELTG